MSNGPIPKILTTSLLLAGACFFATVVSAAQPKKLPETTPVPELGEEAPQELPATADKPPLPELRPAGTDAEGLDAPPTDPQDIPIPEEKPQEPAPALPEAVAPPAPEPARPSNEETAKPADRRSPPRPLDPRADDKPDPSGKMPAEELACRERLRTLGVEFEDRPAESDATVGCSIPYPVALKTLGKDIDLEPKAKMNCRMAEAAARFTQTVVAPAARAECGTDGKSISQASAYVCRPRNGTQTISEHAFGNALDIASFTLSDGTTVAVELRPEEKPAIFLGRVRKAACGPFKTVLGPGSDADHATHLHLDLEPRRNGGTFCQ